MIASFPGLSLRSDVGVHLLGDLPAAFPSQPDLSIKKPTAATPAVAARQPQRTTSADTRLLEAIVWLKKEGAGSFMTGSALHTAVTTNCLKVVETLLSVDPSSACALNAKGETPVHAAIEARSIDALRLLVSPAACACSSLGGKDKGLNPPLCCRCEPTSPLSTYPTRRARRLS